MAERPDYALTTIVQKAKEEHKVDPTISYDFIRSRIQQIYDNPQLIEGKSFAVDISSMVNRISLENTLIVTEEPKKHIYIPRRHELIPCANSAKSNLPENELKRIKRDWKKVCALRNGGTLQGDYEIDGVSHNYRTLGSLTNHLYLIAESAEFRFDSENYAKHIITEGEGRIDIIKLKDGTLSLENVVIAIDRIKVNRAKDEYLKIKGSFAGALLGGFIYSIYLTTKDSDSTIGCLGLIGSGAGSFFLFLYMAQEYFNNKLWYIKNTTGDLNISFYGQVPAKSRGN